MTKYGRRDIINISDEERDIVTKKINATFSSYHRKYDNRIYSAEFESWYDFDIIEFDNYIFTGKDEIKDVFRDD